MAMLVYQRVSYGEFHKLGVYHVSFFSWRNLNLEGCALSMLVNISTSAGQINQKKPPTGTNWGNWGVRHAAHPSWCRLVLWCFHISWHPNFYFGNALLHAADLIPDSNLSKTFPFDNKMQPVSQCAKHDLVTVYATCVSPVQFFSFPRNS